MISYPLTLPTTKSLASIRLIQRTQSAFYRSPFNGSMQVQSNQGEWWEAQVQFPPMKRYQAEEYLATLMGLRGPQGAIYLGDTNAKTAQGAVSRVGNNLFIWTEAFDNAAWTRTGLSAVTANATTAPDGTTTADKLVENSSTSFHSVNQNESFTGGPRCLSVYAKPAGRNWIWIGLGSAIVYFNVSTGVVGNISGGVVATIAAAANGFYRCSVYHPTVDSSARWIGATSGNGASSYLGDGASGVYVWGAELESASSPSTYIGVNASPSILVNGASQTGRIMLVDGCPPSTLVWKRGDYIQLGAGFNATRVKTSGGSSVYKILSPAMSISFGASGVTYRTSLRVKNVGSVTATFEAYGAGTVVAVAPGVETTVVMDQVGDGSTVVGYQIKAPTSGDSLDLVMWDPVTRKFGVYENLLPLANRKFSGFVTYSGSTITLTQSISQRLHKVMEDVTSDASGNAEIPLFPTLRHSPFDNEPVISSNCKGVFRLATPQFDFNIDSDLAYGFSAQLVEAL